MKINEHEVAILGDPHLGRRFVNGVPLHRRGEREKMQEEAFKKSLNDVNGCDLHVCMGDLFNAFVVPPEVVLFAAEEYRLAAERNPNVTFVVLMGNHDGSRDATKRSSFDLFAEIVDGIENIAVVRDGADVFIRNGLRLAFFPWHPFKTSREIVAELPVGGPFDAVFGHWDIESFGDQEVHNILPYDELSEITKLVVTGHVHKPQTFERGDLKVVVTGSMMPYAHGEDDGEMFVTLTLKEALERDDLKDKCVRILLAEGEELPDIDCLQLTSKRVVTQEAENLEVEIEDFNFKNLFFEVMADEGVKDDIQKEVWSGYEALRESRSVA